MSCRGIRCDRVRIHRNLFVAVLLHASVLLVKNVDQLIALSVADADNGSSPGDHNSLGKTVSCVCVCVCVCMYVCMQVLVECGLTDAVTAATESTMCHYELMFTSPAACSQPPVAPSTDPVYDEL